MLLSAVTVLFRGAVVDYYLSLNYSKKGKATKRYHKSSQCKNFQTLDFQMVHHLSNFISKKNTNKGYECRKT